MTTPTIELKPSSNPLSDAEREAILASPGFGRHFTDHMVTIRWTEGRGWHDAELVPYGPLSLDPANMTLHYAQEIFEGLKAYRQPDGSVASFRPDANARRFQRSAAPSGHARAARRDVHRGVRRAGPAGQGMGPGPRRRGVPLPAPVHDRHRGRPRREAGQRVPLPGHRLARRRLLPRRREAGLHLALARTASAPSPAVSATPRPAATTPPPSSPRPRPPPTAAPRSPTSTPSSTSGSRSSAG